MRKALLIVFIINTFLPLKMYAANSDELIYEEKTSKKSNFLKKFKRKKSSILINSLNFESKSHEKLAFKIAYCATSLIENHYLGIDSFVVGSEYLKRLQEELEQTNNENSLKNILKRCQADKKQFKREKRTKFFSEEQKEALNSELQRIFPSNPDLITYLKKAYTVTLDCSEIRGATVGIAVIVGGYLGGYKHKCVSPLGRKFNIYALKLGPTVGFAAIVSGRASKDVGTITKVKKEPSLQKTRARVAFNAQSAGAVIAGVEYNGTLPVGKIRKEYQDEEERKHNTSKISSHGGKSFGGGIYGGLGLEAEARKGKKANFDELFTNLMTHSLEQRTVTVHL